MKALCIYHGNCDDGFAAAWAVRHALGETNVEFYAGQYGHEPPDVSNRDVILVDFSYKRPVLEAMRKKARTILILDHHKTAQEDLAPFGLIPSDSDARKIWHSYRQDADLQAEGEDCLVVCRFDMERSGAGMAWDFFHPGEHRLEFIDYIEDRDLWRKKMPGGDDFTMALRSYPQDFAVWDGLVQSLDKLVFIEGPILQRYYRARVEELKRGAYRSEINYHGETGLVNAICMAVNAPYFAASEVAGEVAAMDGVDFGLCYFEGAGGEFYYSLRSRGDFDVSAIAKTFGGGGHKNAAGFKSKAPVHIRAITPAA